MRAAAHGNSGGPAVGDDSLLIGVLTFISLSESGSVVQGFNFLIPAPRRPHVPAGHRGAARREQVQPGVGRRRRGAVRRAVHDGRRQACTRPTRSLPNLTDLKRALAEAEFKIKNPPPRPFPWAWTTLGVSLLSAGAYGGMFARRWWHNRFRILPAQVIAAIEAGDVPVLLDVRTKTDFETSPLRLPGAVRVDPESLGAADFKLEVEPEQMMVAYCTSPEEATSAVVAQKLRERGFKRVRILKGGLGGWTNARLPVESKSHLPSIGLEIYKNLTLGDLERRHFKAGEVILKEGAEANGEAYVVHSGVVEMRRVFDGENRLLGTHGRGRAVRRHGAVPSGAALGRHRRAERRRAARHQERAAGLADPQPPAARRRARPPAVQLGRPDGPGARAGESMTDPLRVPVRVLAADLPLPDLRPRRRRRPRSPCRRRRRAARPARVLLVPTGLALAIPPGFAGFVLPAPASPCATA